MPKGYPNLKNGNPDTQFKSGHEAVEAGRKGGKASGEAKRERKLLSEEILKRMGAEDWEEICRNLITRSKESDASLALLRDTIGQKPTDKQEVKMDATVQTVEEYLRQFDED